jgi:rubrerythrin
MAVHSPTKPAVPLDEALPAGALASGDYRCADCGYGITATRELPVCPMCRGESWREHRWSPFAGRHTRG